MITEGFLAALFVWAVVDGDYGEAAVLGLRWIALFTVWALAAAAREDRLATASMKAE